MGLYRNVASQKVAVYAHDIAADAAKTGDAANITAQISKDFAAAAATNDTNPTELDAADHPGIYVFDLTQAETEADNLIISAVSSTASIKLDPVQVFTDDRHKYGIKAWGVAQSASDTTVVLAAGEIFANDVLIGNTIAVYGSTQGYWQEKVITDSVLATDTVTVSTFTVTPTGTITYKIFGTPAGAGVAQTGDCYVLLDTEIAALLAYVDTEVAAIKAKTDSLTFTVATVLDANVQRVNDVALVGDGDATPWGPA
jgi:hypothetical protein